MEDMDNLLDPMTEMQRKMEDMQRRLDEYDRKANQEPLTALCKMFLPDITQFLDRGWGPQINASHFELNPTLIQIVQAEQFGGRETEDPNEHLRDFLDICDTIKQDGVEDDTIRMRLFGFSLRDKAKDWYRSLDRSDITTWEQLCRKFLARYFPPSKVQKLIADICQFTQSRDESICEAWERYRKMLRKCPQHDLNQAQQIAHFYSGLTYHTRIIVDATAGGCLLNRTATEALRVIEEMSDSFQWPMEWNSRKMHQEVVEQKWIEDVDSADWQNFNSNHQDHLGNEEIFSSTYRVCYQPKKRSLEEEKCMTLELMSETSQEEPGILNEEFGVEKEEKSMEDEKFKTNEDCKVFNVVDLHLDTNDGLTGCLFHFYLTPFFDFYVDSSNESFLKCGGSLDPVLGDFDFQVVSMIVKPSYYWDSTNEALQFDEKWPPPTSPSCLVNLF